MTKLGSLRSQLGSLRRSRQTARWVTALAALVVAALWILGVIFLIDVLMDSRQPGGLSVLQRLILFAVGIAGLVWVYTKYALPLLSVEEDETDMALMVQRQHGIDSDLVAAMQFESPEADKWGSRELEDAVIDYVADLDKGLDVYEGFDREQMTRRVTLLAVTVGIVAIAAFLAPQYFQVFLQRLALSSKHYPSDTVIERLAVNETNVLQFVDHGTSPDDAHAAQGQPLLLTAWTTGELPAQGNATLHSQAVGGRRDLQMQRVDRVELVKAQDQLRRVVDLDPNDSSAQSELSEDDRHKLALLTAQVSAAETLTVEEALSNPVDHRTRLEAAIGRFDTLLEAWPEAEESALYVGKLPRLLDGVEYSVRLGDAWTDPAMISMIPLPVIVPNVKVTPPEYARSDDADKEEESVTSLQRSVIEGSSVELALTASKPLKSATFRLIEHDDIAPEAIALEQADDEGIAWQLPKNTPLADVVKPIRFQLEVTDEDGLKLDAPLRGYIRLKADRPPQIAGSLVDSSWVSTARPEIEFRLSDDYGVAKLEVRAEVTRAPNALGEPASGPTSYTLPINEALKQRFGLSQEQIKKRKPEAISYPLRGSGLLRRGAYVMDLAPLELKRGDEVRLTLVATDFRGDQPGQASESETMVLDITDVSAVLASVSEREKLSLEHLDDLIRREIGIGSSP